MINQNIQQRYKAKKLKDFLREVLWYEVDAEGSTLTSTMMHLVQPGCPLGGCLVRPFGQQGTT